MIQAGYVRDVEPRALRGGGEAVATPMFEPEILEWIGGGGYSQQRKPRWAMLGIILGLHAALFAALAIFDVIHVGHKRHMPRLTIVELKPDPIAPPPAPKQEQTVRQPETPIQPPIVAPPPIVQAPAVSVPVATVPVAPPPPPSAPAPAAAPSVDAAPITPPDASARNLGNPSPKYPMQARLRRWEGTVRLRVVITPDGHVKDISVAHSSGFDALDKEALETVRKWKFEPGRQSGVAVEAVGFLSIPFHLT